MSENVFQSIKVYLKPGTELVERTKARIPCRENENQLESCRKFDKAAIIPAAFAVAVAALLLFPHFNLGWGDLSNNKEVIPPSGSLSSASKVPVRVGFSVMVYSPKTANQSLTPDFLKETVQTKLKPDSKVLMAHYSPLTSSVPGYPFRFESAKSDTKNTDAYKIRIITDKGRLLDWNRKNGSVTDYGKEYEMNPDNTLFWSPLEDAKMATRASITVSMIKNEEKVGEQIISIEEENNLYYAVVH